VLAVLLAAPAASAFCRTTTDPNFVPTSSRPCDTANKQLFWASKCVGYSLNRAASKQVSLDVATKLTDEAFAEWARHDCSEGGASCGTGKASISASNLGPVDCASVEHTQGGSNANIIMFRDGVWPHEGTALALTTVTFKVDTGEIYDVDMEVQSNPNDVKLAVSDPIQAGQYDLKSILTHEAGHFLGMAHTPVAQATMLATYRPGETFMRDLSGDDICGLCAAYPPSRQGTCNPTPRGGLTPKCGGAAADPSCGCSTPGQRGGFAGFVVAMLAIGVLHRRRR
jgi:MYXO-CTERM domain-containing protein